MITFVLYVCLFGFIISVISLTYNCENSYAPNYQPNHHHHHPTITGTKHTLNSIPKYNFHVALSNLKLANK